VYATATAMATRYSDGDSDGDTMAITTTNLWRIYPTTRSDLWRNARIRWTIC
jgi:hypothetical protein